MATPKHTLSLDVKVGIYDAEYVARIYHDKIIVVSPYVKWVGNSGGYDERKEAIRDQRIVDSVLSDMADDAESSAWAKIGGALGDAYLEHQGSGQHHSLPPGRA